MTQQALHDRVRLTLDGGLGRLTLATGRRQRARHGHGSALRQAGQRLRAYDALRAVLLDARAGLPRRAAALPLSYPATPACAVRSSRLSILPLGFFGRASASTTRFGHL